MCELQFTEIGNFPSIRAPVESSQFCGNYNTQNFPNLRELSLDWDSRKICQKSRIVYTPLEIAIQRVLCTSRKSAILLYHNPARARNSASIFARLKSRIYANYSASEAATSRSLQLAKDRNFSPIIARDKSANSRRPRLAGKKFAISRAL